MKHVLFLSYYFPPAGGSAVQRILKFVKYLPEYGWMPFVVTTESEKIILKDESLIKDIPENIKIIRTSSPDLYNFYSRFTGKAKTSDADLSALAAGSKETSLLSKAAVFIRAAFFIPDARVGWLPYVLRESLKIIRKNRIHVIFASAPPFTTLLAGAFLSKLTGIPFIADYRDPWTGAYFYFQRPLISTMFEKFLEKRCILTANRIIAINQPIAEIIKDVSRRGESLSEKIRIIPNGFDPADFEDIDPVIENGKFTVVYTGTQHARMNSVKFIRSIEKAVRSEPEIGKYLLIKFIGRTSQDVRGKIHNSKIRRNIKFIEHIPHRECLNHAAGADLLLLLIPETPGNELIVTGKLFEYLRSGMPILCLAHRGDAADIIRKANAGYTIAPDNIDEQVSFIVKSFNRFKNKKPLIEGKRDQAYIQGFSRKRSTQKLADIFNEVLT